MSQPTHVTAGIITRGQNPEALSLLVSALLMGRRRPHLITIRYDGDSSIFTNFYIAQLTRLAAFYRVGMTLLRARPTNVRDARDHLCSECHTELLWMLDDDVLPETPCLEQLWSAYHQAVSPNLAFLAGSKPDLVNLRDYPSFSWEPHGRSALKPNVPQNWVWEVASVDDVPPVTSPTEVLDTGNCLFVMSVMRDASACFRTHERHYNSSGDDTLMAMQLKKAGKEGLFVPMARAWHLEKPSGGFGEAGARGEMLLRTAEAQDYDTGILKHFMPGLHPS